MNQYLRTIFRFARSLKGIIVLGITSFLLIIGIAASKTTAQSPSAQPISQTAAAQIQALVQEKQSRTSEEQKISSALVYAAKAKRGDALVSKVPSLSSVLTSKSLIEFSAGDKVKIEIKTNSPVTPALIQQVQAMGSQVLSAPSGYNTIVAVASLDKLKDLASLSNVRKIGPFIRPRLLRDTSTQEEKPLTSNDLSPASQDISATEQVRERLAALPQFKQLLAQVPEGAIPNAGSVTSEGDYTHGAALARSRYKVDGSWKKTIGAVTQTQRVKIGVLSDSYNNLNGAATDISRGELPSDGVTLVGSGDLASGGTDEGRAMLQIIHDLAPGAKLYFATAFNSQADFANNIRALRKAGCDIIVDDIIWFAEPVFQDGIVAQAVNDVTASGALYFSSAGNFGNKNDNTSGVWEGDFVDGGPAPLGLGGRVHKFSSSPLALSNRITAQAGPILLNWSDPLGQSSNDYDLYILNSTGTQVILASTDFQSGNGDPFEGIFYYVPSGYQVVVVKYSGQRRYLHLNSSNDRGLAINTRGQTWGHSAAEKAFSVAAVKAQGLNNLFTGGAANPVETFSSDGPRRVFYKADGTPYTPGKFLSTGGVVRQKPDIAAADGVRTSVPGFSSFFGTSAAAPHAAGVAALLKSFRPSLTPDQMRRILTSTALDIEAKGVDQDSGHGIVMANRALQRAVRFP
jgi:subtilisin family serine protease